MPTNLLLLPLLGGYWFLHAFQYTRFRSQRLDGYRLLMESALMGVLFAAIARPLIMLAGSCPCIRTAWQMLAPDVPFLGTAFVSLGLGLSTPYALNGILNRTGMMSRADAQAKAIDRHGNQLLRLLHTASREERPVSITLDNRKVYIGTVAAAPNLEAHDGFVALTPFFSGYRAAETLSLVLTVPYLHVYEREGFDPEDFNVTIPLSSGSHGGIFRPHSVSDVPGRGAR